MWPGARGLLRTKWHLDASSRLATIHVGQKLGGGVPFFLGELDPHRTQSPGPTEHKVTWAKAYLHIYSGILVHPGAWPQRTLAENWGSAPLGEGELGPHLTQCRLG